MKRDANLRFNNVLFAHTNGIATTTMTILHPLQRGEGGGVKKGVKKRMEKGMTKGLFGQKRLSSVVA